MKSEITYPKDKIINNDRFDFKEFRELRAREFYELKNEDANLAMSEENFYPVHKILPDGTVVEMTPQINGKKEVEEYCVSFIPPSPSLFETIKFYHKNGIISKILSHVYIGEIYSPSGVTQIYDKNGILEKTINDDKRYDGMINVDDLMNILIKNKLLNPYDDIDRKLYTIAFDEKRMIWRAEHHTDYFSGDIIEVDALTGKIISKKHVVRDDSQDHE